MDDAARDQKVDSNYSSDILQNIHAVIARRVFSAPKQSRTRPRLLREEHSQ
jgi:hypothetical protein